jgi:hypothetical protein
MKDKFLQVVKKVWSFPLCYFIMPSFLFFVLSLMFTLHISHVLSFLHLQATKGTKLPFGNLNSSLSSHSFCKGLKGRIPPHHHPFLKIIIIIVFPNS